MHKRLTAALAYALILAGMNIVSTACAQSAYPTKPIRLIIGYTPGGPTDITGRIVAQKLSEHLDQPVIVENRAGASGTIATERVATSPADGYTLLIMTGADTIQPALRTNLPYDLERSFAPVSMLATGPLLLVVHPSVPARDVKELLGLARSHPGKLSYGSAGVGTTSHLAGELLKLITRMNIVHVPYKSSADSALATASGQIDMGFPGLPGALPLLNVNKLRALAVTTAKRASLLPSTPTLDESVAPGYDRSGWYGVLAPAGVPKNVIARLNAVIVKLANSPEMKESLNKQGLDPLTNTPEQFAAFIKNEIAQNAKLIKLSGARTD